jgi:hypothetical protein
MVAFPSNVRGEAFTVPVTSDAEKKDSGRDEFLEFDVNDSGIARTRAISVIVSIT